MSSDSCPLIQSRWRFCCNMFGSTRSIGMTLCLPTSGSEMLGFSGDPSCRCSHTNTIHVVISTRILILTWLKCMAFQKALRLLMLPWSTCELLTNLASRKPHLLVKRLKLRPSNACQYLVWNYGEHSCFPSSCIMSGMSLRSHSIMSMLGRTAQSWQMG